MMLKYLARFPRRFARQYCLTANTIRYVIEYRCIVGLLSKSNPPFRRLIDVGAGSGEMSARLVEQGFAETAIAVEPDQRNFQLLQRRYALLKGCQCINSSVEAASIDVESADGILSTQVLEHIADHDAAVSAIHSMLKPSGFAIISVPHPPELFPNQGHVRPGYTKSELTNLFKRHGFEFIQHDYFLILPTLRRLIASEELGSFGRFLPISWADREAKLTTAEKAELQPYGITCLFQRQ
jgi:2-polyprenyl-3-methyl-5-hydroxy-6-metoxy-1,4-benzoquinol methylase